MPLRQPLTYLELYTPLKMLILKVQKCILKFQNTVIGLQFKHFPYKLFFKERLYFFHN